MKLPSSKRYPSTKFVALHDSTTGPRGKGKVLWISLAVIATALIATSAAYFSCGVLIECNDTRGESPPTGSLEPENNSSFNFDSWVLAETRKRLGKGGPELVCKESRTRAIPLDVIFNDTNTLGTRFPGLHHFVALDLLLYYEDLTNKHDPRALKPMFEGYHLKLSQVKTSREFSNFIRGLDSNKFKYYAGRGLHLDPKDFGHFFDWTLELRRWYEYLDRLRSFLSLYGQQKRREEYRVQVTEVNFDEFARETQEKLFRVPFPFSVTERKLEEINEILSEWAAPVRIEINNSSVVFFNRALLLSEVKEKLPDLHVAGLKSVFVFASRLVYVDDDFTLSGVNLAIIAPRWVFLRKVKINLNGTAGEEHEPDVAEPGDHGKPGNPGGNAGNFLGMGDLKESHLQVDSDGGRGGRGQNGAAGRPGMNFSRPDPPVDKPTCLTKLSTFSNTFGQTITHYKVFGAAGCGGAGTDGGVGGEGGRGGEITLISTRRGLKTARGKDGETGAPGKGGPGGVGGRPGCMYEALDIDDEILHCVTDIKCPVWETLPSGEPGRDNENERGKVISPARENLTISETLFQFIRLAADDFLRRPDPLTTSFFEEYAQFLRTNLLEIFKFSEALDDFELYDLLRRNVFQPSEEPLFNSLILGKMSAAKKNANYFFLDFGAYLTGIKRSIGSTKETTRDFPPVAQLREKIGVKLLKIKENLRGIKKKLIARAGDDDRTIMKLLGEFTSGGDYGSLAEALQEKRIACVGLAGAEVMASALDPRSVGDGKHFDSLCSTSDVLLKNGTGGQSEILARATTFAPSFHDELKLLRDARETLSKTGEEGGKQYLLELRDALPSVGDSLPRSERKVLLESLAEELEHLMAVYDFLEWEELEKAFENSLLGLSRAGGYLKRKLIEVAVNLQYKLAVDAARQRVYPFVKLDRRLRQPRNTTVAEAAEEEIDRLRDVHRENGFCRNTLEAVFDAVSAVGEFYRWPNAEIRSELEDLFAGLEISLKSSLINHHVLDKNFIRFTSVRFDLDCRENSCGTALEKALSHFKIEVTHSGYSRYNWRGETRVIVSEEVTFDYSFRTRRNGEPEFYNALFKKCQDGDIMLSPYTTWRVRLVPIRSVADYRRLSPFVDLVDVRLTGTGTFVS